MLLKSNIYMAEIMKPYTMDELRAAVNCSEKIIGRNVYRVNMRVASKFVGYSYRAEHEQRMGRAVQRKANVPDVYGAELLDGNWYSMMQFINGVPIAKTIGNGNHEATGLRDAEILKILDLGIVPFGCFHPYNALVTPDKMVFLIDFELWDYGSEADIRSHRKKLLKQHFE